MKYKYEYSLQCIDLCNGGIKKTGFKSYQEAKYTMAQLSGLWKIEKYRVYK